MNGHSVFWSQDGVVNFLDAQEAAFRNTKWYQLAFVLSLLTVMALIGGLVTISSYFWVSNDSGYEGYVFAAGSTFAAFIILAPYLHSRIHLSAGAEMVAHDLGARLLDRQSPNHRERVLNNVVEEMALASGVPVPKIYIIDREDGINALSVGTEMTNAAIIITKASLLNLTREELQGIVAHEFSHILNGDMRLNMKMISWVSGLMGISMIGKMLLASQRRARFSSPYNRRRNGQERNPVEVTLILALGFILIGSFGVFLGRILQARVSREREYLADASAVQFTRNPDSISSVLKKIKNSDMGSGLLCPAAMAMNHMFFADSQTGYSFFKSQPKLSDRINRVEDKKYSDIENTIHDGENLKRTSTKNIVNSNRSPRKSGSLSHVSPRLLEAAHNSEESQILMLAILVSEIEKGTLASHLNLEKFLNSRERVELLRQWSETLFSSPCIDKITLMDLALPSLRQMSIEREDYFCSTIEAVILSDHAISFFEYMFSRILSRNLASNRNDCIAPQVKYSNIVEIIDHVNKVFTTCSYLNNTRSLTNNEIEKLDTLLEKFQYCSPVLKGEILEYVETALIKDGHNLNTHMELFRLLAEVLGVPFSLPYDLIKSKKD